MADRVGPLYAGSLLIITCTVLVSDVMVISATVSMNWTKGGEPLTKVSSGDSRVTEIKPSLLEGGNGYVGSLNFNPLLVGDSGEYSCSVVVSSPDPFIISVTVSNVTNITVQCKSLLICTTDM